MQKKLVITKVIVLSAIALIAISVQAGDDKDNKAEAEDTKGRRSRGLSFIAETEGVQIERDLQALEKGEVSDESSASTSSQPQENLTYLLMHHMAKNRPQLSEATRNVFARKIGKWLEEQDSGEKEELEQLFAKETGVTRSKKEREISAQLKMFEVQQQLLQHLIESSDEANELQMQATQREIRQARKGIILAITGFVVSGVFSIASLITTIVIAATGS